MQLVALKSTILVLYLEAAPAAHLAARAHCHPDALPPGPEGVSPLLSCELVEGSSIVSSFLDSHPAVAELRVVTGGSAN